MILKELLVDALRYGLPTVGAGVGILKGQKSCGPSLACTVKYGAAGWAIGWVAQYLVLWALDSLSGEAMPELPVGSGGDTAPDGPRKVEGKAEFIPPVATGPSPSPASQSPEVAAAVAAVYSAPPAGEASSTPTDGTLSGTSSATSPDVRVPRGAWFKDAFGRE